MRSAGSQRSSRRRSGTLGPFGATTSPTSRSSSSWSARSSVTEASNESSIRFQGPIQQEVVGEKGCYTQYNSTYKKKMKVQEFKKLATSPKYLKPKEFK